MNSSASRLVVLSLVVKGRRAHRKKKSFGQREMFERWKASGHRESIGR